ncbi:MAG: transposase [Muribaculaceae bacterium]|nr:transposase [Muribaculaceae bacterium]
MYPDLKEAYWSSQNLRAIFSNKNSTADTARLNLARRYNRVADSGFKSFNTIAATFYEHSDEIINFFINRSTNASAESMNSKIKAFRAKLHGVNDTKFFIFRLCNLYA